MLGMSKTKLAFLAIGNGIICAQAFLMIGLAMADARIVIEPGMGALVAALALFITSGVNMTVIYDMQRRSARRREAAAKRAAAGVTVAPQGAAPPVAERQAAAG